ncbi:MAG: hypothetical protein GY805_35475 [Chloroflexi bacterium]|nr:hypothetical protein [Chloroflexota bacterium]
MLNQKQRFLWWMTAVLLLAAFFRLFAIQDVPPGLSQDEVLNADIVHFIRGGYHALFFREGFGHEPLYHYFSVPFQYLLGDNVLSIRLPAVTLGLFLVALTMRWVRREFGVTTAVISGVGLAISWWPIIFSRIGIRPILEPVLLLLSFWFWPKRPLLSGLILGLSLYSYTGARVLFLIPLLLAVYWLFMQRERGVEEKNLAFYATIVLAMALLVSAPLFLTLRADPTLQQRVDQLAGPLEALQEGDVEPILQSMVATVGVFSFTGDPRWTYTLPQRPLFDWGTAVLFYAGLALAFWRWKQPAYATVLIWLGVTFIPSAVTPQSPSIVRLVGALPVVYLLPSLAVTAVITKLKSTNRSIFQKAIAKRLLILIFSLLLLLNLSRTVIDGFIRWPQTETTRLNHYQTVLLDIARHLRESPAENLVIAEAFFEPIDRDSFIRDLGKDPQARWVQTGNEVAGAVVFPVGGNGRFYVPEFAAPAPDIMKLAGIDTTPQFRSQTQPSFAIYELPAAPHTLKSISPILLGESVSLIGYEIFPPSQESQLIVYTLWRVEKQLPPDLAAFVHLQDAEHEIVAQHDGFDAATVTLQSGDVVLQRHILQAERPLQPADYTLFVGLYTRGNDQRLLLPDQTDRFMLMTSLIIDEK